MTTGQVLLAIIGIGIIVVGVMILMRQTSPSPLAPVTIIRDGPYHGETRREVNRGWGGWSRRWDGRGFGWGGAPYYSHKPFRPLVY